MRDAAAQARLPDAPERGVAATVRFIWRNRMFTPRYWVFALRYLWWFKVRNRHVTTRGIVFLGRRTRIRCARGLAHMELGRWVWIGEGTSLRCHEGFLRIGDKVVFGSACAVNAYLDVEVGEETLVADSVYIADFDHRYDDPGVPIRKQGIRAAPVRIESDCWIGSKATVLRGTTVGRGSVVGAHAVVTGDIPPGSVAVGVPARVVKQRRKP